MRNMINRILVGIVIAVVIFGVILAGHYYDKWVVSTALCILIGIAIWETRNALGEAIPRKLNLLVFIFSAGFGLPYFYLNGFSGVAFFILVVFIVGCAFCMFNRFPNGVLQNFAFLLIYPALLLSTLFYINRGSGVEVSNYDISTVGLMLVIMVSSCTDVFAYFIGITFGKHKLIPEISPKKSVEGAIGGIFGGIFGAGVIFCIFEVFEWITPGLPLDLPWKILAYCAVGLLGSVATQIGDLVASFVKRNCGIKDYSRLLGPHGGIMDRVDGIMMNAALVALLYAFFL